MPTICDHAVLRYLERVYGVDVEAVREEMRSPALETANDFGAATVIKGNGGRLILRSGVVVTTLPKRGN